MFKTNCIFNIDLQRLTEKCHSN